MDLKGENGEKYERKLVYVEYTPEVPEEPGKCSNIMRVLVWNHKKAESEDFCGDYSAVLEISIRQLLRRHFLDDVIRVDYNRYIEVLLYSVADLAVM